MPNHPRCIVKNCRNSTYSSSAPPTDVTFHRFPINGCLRDRWIFLLQIDAQAVTDSSLLCSDHFDGEDLRNRRKIKELLPKAITDTGAAASAGTQSAAGFSIQYAAGIREHDYVKKRPRTPQNSARARKMMPPPSVSSRYHGSPSSEPELLSQGSGNSSVSRPGSGKTDPSYKYESSPNESFVEKLYKDGDQDRPKQGVLEPDDKRQFIVNETQLRLLLKHCPDCGSSCSNVVIRSFGVDFVAYFDCKKCDEIVEWSSQPPINETQLNRGNLELTTAPAWALKPFGV